MQRRIIFLCYHAFGHVNACLKIAETLKQNGDEVGFAGIILFRKYVERQGFPYYELNGYPIGHELKGWANQEAWINRKKKPNYLSVMRLRLNDGVAKSRETALRWMIKELYPDIILLDAFQASDFILMYQNLKQSDIKIALLHTTLPTRIRADLPPLNSDIFPNDAMAVNSAIKKLKWKQFVRRTQKKFLNIGLDDRFILNRRIKKNKIPKMYISHEPNLLNFALTGIDEFVIVPKEFDFPHHIPEEQTHYVGFQLSEKRIDETNVTYEKQKSIIHQLRTHQNLKTIYCSFGTTEIKSKKIVLHFLEKLVDISHQEKFVFVISLRAQREDLLALPVSDKVFVFSSVPQLEVLRYTDVFITHGGINSIKEALYAGVPMLMYPIHSDYDPRGNAARVAYHKLGLRGDAIKDSKEDIVEKIKELLANPAYKKNIHDLKMKDLAYSSQRFLEKMDQIKFLL